jgi:hypothetical protein
MLLLPMLMLMIWAAGHDQRLRVAAKSHQSILTMMKMMMTTMVTTMVMTWAQRQSEVMVVR